MNSEEETFTVHMFWFYGFTYVPLLSSAFFPPPPPYMPEAFPRGHSLRTYKSAQVGLEFPQHPPSQELQQPNSFPS